MFKKAQVMLLPTEKVVIGDIYLTSSKTLAKCDYGTLHLAYNNVQHLYIINDDKITKDDTYVYCLSSNEIIKLREDFKQNIDVPYYRGVADSDLRKIISTTDKDLIDGIRWDKEFPLPQPSQQFIEKYIEEYNKGNVITEVMVEYENEDMDFDPAKPNSINWVKKLKINPKENTVTIRKQKDSFSREEVENLLLKALTTNGKGAFNMGWDTEDALEYIKQNL